MIKRRRKSLGERLREIPVGICVFFILVGSLLASVFVSSLWQDGGLISREEAIPTCATFESYKVFTTSKGYMGDIQVNFVDGEERIISGACTDVEMEAALSRLEKGDVVDMLLHPKSGEIWEMRAGDELILSFEDARVEILVDMVGIIVFLVAFCLFCAVTGAVSLVLQLLRKRKMRNI